MGLMGVGAGWGLGSAWTLNSIDFEKERKGAMAQFAPKTKAP